MTTRRTTPVGSAGTTPTPAAQPAGSEVTAPVAVNPAQGPGTAHGAAAPKGSVGDALAAFTTALGPLEDAVTPYLQTMTPVERKRRGRVSAVKQGMIPLLIRVLRDWPALAADLDPEVLSAALTAGTNAQALGQVLQSLLDRVQDTSRLSLDAVWLDVSQVYKAAGVRARKDTDLASRIAPVRAALRQGKAVAAAARVASTSQQRAANATARATLAQQRAEASRLAAAHTQAAHAARHPTVGTPVPAAVSQGPAVTTPADAGSNQGPAVNPQGPAPGR